MGAVLVLVAVNDGTLPIPLGGTNPISGTGDVLVQAKVAPTTELVKTIEGTTVPAQ